MFISFLSHHLIIYFALLVYSVHKNHLNRSSTKICIQIFHHLNLCLISQVCRKGNDGSGRKRVALCVLGCLGVLLSVIFSLRLLQDPHAEEFEDKDWTFVIENVSAQYLYGGNTFLWREYI